MCLRLDHKIRPRSAVKIYGVLFVGLKVCRFDQKGSHVGSLDQNGAADILGLVLHHKDLIWEMWGLGSYGVLHYGLFTALKL